MLLQIIEKTNTISTSLYSKLGTKAQAIIDCDVDTLNARIASFGTYLPNGCLPPSVRYMDLATGIVLFERPPTYINISFTNQYQAKLKAEGRAKRSFRIPIPWQRYVVYLGSNGLPSTLFVFFAGNQIQSLDNDPMSSAPLPNLYTNGTVCLPVYDHRDVVHFDIGDGIYNMYETVWGSGFNLDVVQCLNNWLSNNAPTHPLTKFPNNIDNIVSFYNHWSNFNLEQIMKMNWHTPLYNSFTQLISSIPPTEQNHDSFVDLYLAIKG